MFDFLLNGDLADIENERIDKNVLGQIKFDDKKFEIERENFMILGKNKLLINLKKQQQQQQHFFYYK